ncbi:MAG: hypothetical protein ACRYHQ_22710 [Janthinobacterium lividum]
MSFQVCPLPTRRRHCEARNVAAIQRRHDRRMVLAAPVSPRRERLAMTASRMAQPASPHHRT